MAKTNAKTPVFRYVAIDLTDNYALQLEVDKLLKVGEIISRYDPDDRKMHNFRILRIEGTSYNKSFADLYEQEMREYAEKEVKTA